MSRPNLIPDWLRWLLVAIGAAMTIALILNVATVVRDKKMGESVNPAYAIRQQPPQNALE